LRRVFFTNEDFTTADSRKPTASGSSAGETPPQTPPTTNVPSASSATEDFGNNLGPTEARRQARDLHRRRGYQQVIQIAGECFLVADQADAFDASFLPHLLNPSRLPLHLTFLTVCRKQCSTQGTEGDISLKVTETRDFF